MKSIKIKLLTVLCVFLFIPGTLFAQQSDFYGTWVAKISEFDETVLVEIIISSSNLIMSFELYSNNKLLETEAIEVRINNWSNITNTDETSKANYPNGYSITTELDKYIEEIELFISIDKRQLIISELNHEIGEILVFIKQ